MPVPVPLRVDAGPAIVAERLRLTGVIRSNCGPTSSGWTLHGTASAIVEPYEVRLRVAARTISEADARRVGREAEGRLAVEPARRRASSRPRR
jgi:hypothetical protein